MILLTGLSGAGKTTIGRQVLELWRRTSATAVLVDGDEVRQVLGLARDAGSYTSEGRHRVAERIAAFCGWLDGQGIDVVCCTLTLFPDIARHYRKTLSRYFEVHLAVSFEAACRRDTKDLYGPALRGEARNVVGVDIPYVPPETSDLVIDNDTDRSDLTGIAADILGRALAAWPADDASHRQNAGVRQARSQEGPVRAVEGH